MLLRAISFVDLNNKIILEADNIADILRVGQKFADCPACPPLLPSGRKNSLPKKKISDTTRAIAV